MKPQRAFRPQWPMLAGFALLILAAGGTIWLTNRQQRTDFWVRHTLEVQSRLNHVQALAMQAETGQRGFLLSGREAYLKPFYAARGQILPEVDALAQLTSDNGEQRHQIMLMRATVRAKLAELETTIELSRSGRRSAALAVVNSDRGAALMARLQQITAAMQTEEQRLLAERSSKAEHWTELAQAALIASSLLILLLAFMTIRDARLREEALRASNERLETEAAEREFAQGQVRQLQKMEAVGQLTGGIAHDFNNMLAIVIGSLDLARRRLSGTEHPNLSKCIDNATEGAQRAAVLTARLLAFSRQQPLDPKVLDANKLVGGMSEMLRRTIGEPIRIETVLAGGLWRVCADPAQVESALVNLAVNARDAMPDGGHLTIETANCHLDDAYAQMHDEVAPGQYVMISVTDTGVGMPPEVVDRAFEPFYTTKGVGKGTGLGLSQIFGFLKQSKGHVKIYSEPGHGTNIKLYLPRYEGSDPTQAVAARSATLPMGMTDEIILVVEDEAQVRHMSVDALRELGYTVIQAATPNEALQQLAMQPRVSLLFTDIVMPDMTGRQLADKASEQRPDLKVLYTTGYTRNAVVHNGVLDSGTAFLAKPFTIEQLAAKVRDVLDGGEPHDRPASSI